jgi:hypothetical protein
MTIRTRTSLTGALVVGGAAFIYLMQRQGRRSAAPARVMTIGKPLAEVERAWHDPALRGTLFASAPHLADQVTVRCRPATPESWGTEVTLVPRGSGAAGAVSSAVPHLADTVLLNLLRRFKALVETGETPTLARNPAGRRRTVAA